MARGALRARAERPALDPGRVHRHLELGERAQRPLPILYTLLSSLILPMSCSTTGRISFPLERRRTKGSFRSSPLQPLQ